MRKEETLFLFQTTKFKQGLIIMNKNTIFRVCLFLTPIPFFLLNYLIFDNSVESLKDVVIGAILCGYGGSIALWLLYKKRVKK